MRASLLGAESVRLDVSAFNSAATLTSRWQASIVHLEQAYWFSCSLCHVLIGCLSHVSCFPLVCSCHVTLIVCYK